MIYVLWASLNLAVVLGLLVIGYRLIRSVYAGRGLFLTLILLCFLSSFFCPPQSDEAKAAPLHSLTFSGGRRSISFREDEGVWHIPDGTAGRYRLKGNSTVAVFKTPFFQIHLYVDYAVDTATGRLMPVFAKTSVEGWQSGIAWKPFAPALQTNETGDEIRYTVNGELKWTLAGFGICTREKEISGIMTSK